MDSKPWEGIVRRKREIRSKALESYQASSEQEYTANTPILDISDAEELTTIYAQGQLKVQAVIQSYVKRAAEAHRQTNCLTEVFFDDALRRAAELDDYFYAHGKLVGPLHGVPVSLKDQFDVKGYDSTIGYVAKAFTPASEDAALVTLLKNLGAVILAKTNLPQSIMWPETENPLWGLTTNPLNPLLTPGGSSGGEAVLLALQGSLIGWGTDLGGSIRIPSHLNGVWGLKPTSSRLPYLRVSNSLEGQQHTPSAVGPMARSLSSLTIVMRNILDSKPELLDPNVVPIPWRQDVYEEIQSRPLVVGVLFDDGVVRVHPPIRRVLDELLQKLKVAGHEIVVWDGEGIREAIDVMDLLYTVDGGEDIRKNVEAGGEPFIPHVHALVNRGKPISVYNYWQLNKRKQAVQQAYNCKWNNTKGSTGQQVDILLLPTMPHVAVPHRKTRWVGYTKIWNILDYTALSFPAGAFSKDQDSDITEGYLPRNEYDAWNWSLYDADMMQGHPIGLQIVGRRFEEEKVLGAAAVIEKYLK